MNNSNNSNRGKTQLHRDKYPPEFIEELRRLVSSKGWSYLKNIAKGSVDHLEGPWPPLTDEHMRRFTRGMLIRKFLNRFFHEIENIAKLPANTTREEKLLNQQMSQGQIESTTEIDIIR